MPEKEVDGTNPPDLGAISLAETDAFRLAGERLSEQLASLGRVSEGIRNWFNNDLKTFRDTISDVIRRWQPAFEDIARYNSAKKTLKVKGILPHRSTPWALFDSSKPNEFPPVVLGYYASEWQVAERVFLEDVDTYQISFEAKSAFVDAVKCHSARLFRSSVLTLLPAAEAEFRRAFGVALGQNGASLDELRMVARKVPAGIILGHFAPLDLFKILQEHIYEPVKTSDALERFACDPVPNRHAAIHGLIIYDTELNSLNTLIMADYIFYLIGQLSAHLIDRK